MKLNRTTTKIVAHAIINNIINKVNNYNDPEKIYIPVKFLEKNIKLKENFNSDVFKKDEKS